MAAHELDDQLHLHMAINTITTLKGNGDITLKQGEPKKKKDLRYQVRKKVRNSSILHPFTPVMDTTWPLQWMLMAP